jgi:xanthine dehydrogenase accessory factor
LILFGNSPVAMTLAKLARVLNFEIDVFDPMATREEFPDATIVEPQINLNSFAMRPLSFVVVSTQGHDDEAALETAVKSGASYVAFVASKKKFATRAEFLRERGLRDEDLVRIKAPAGLDIGALTPDEIAVSILAEIIQVHRQHLVPQKIEAAQTVTAVEEMVQAEAQDPVCGMMVEIATARYISEYAGTKYYFCAASCKSTFDKNPEAFVSQQSTVDRNHNSV